MLTTNPSTIAHRRWLDAARIAWGGWLAAPGGAAADLESDQRTATAIRLAGLRQGAQGVAATVRPTPRVMRWGGYVDLVHAMTMLVAGCLLPSRRRLLLADSAIAAGWGLSGLRAARS